MAVKNALVKTDVLAIPEHDFIKAVAMDIGKEVAHHIETMYPEAVNAASSTFLLSVRNCTYNQIMSWLDTGGQDTARRLTQREQFWRYIRRLYKKVRKQTGDAL
jgi:hypothetical protein